MFSSLARGRANWHGGIQLDQRDDDLISDDFLLPQILLKAGHPVKPSKSFDNTQGNIDGQLLLPKTFVTRKGALLLFTPSEDIVTNEPEHKAPSDVYEDGLTLRTIGNLASSVLQFGKEEEQAWEGIPATPPPSTHGSTHDNHYPIKDRKAFLRFLHYLDSESLTADKHAQPGCDPDFYLDELRTSSRVLSSRRRSQDVQTPYSYRTYTSFLEDDDMSDIVREYIKWNKLEKKLQHENNRPGDDEDIEEDLDIDPYIHSTSPVQHGYPRRSYSLSPQYFYTCQDTLRPSTAPLPPAPETPRANPRITSGRRPPPTRALGSKPDYLDVILQADINRGRVRRGPSPRLKFSRTTTPTFHSGTSRGASPDHGMMPRFETPAAMSSRAEGIIQEVEETEGSTTRPVSVASYTSAHSSQARTKKLSSAGTNQGVDGENSTKMAPASRSGSMSSVSYQKGARSVSGKSRANTRSPSRNSEDFHDEHEYMDEMTSFSKDDSCVLCAPPPSAHMSPQSMSASRETRTVGYPTASVTTTQDGEQPSRDAVTQSRLSHTSNVTLKRGPQSPDLQSRDGVPRSMSRGSSKISSHPNNSPSISPWQDEISRVAGRPARTGSRMSKYGDENTLTEFGGHGLTLRSRSASTRKPKPPTKGGSGRSRPISAPVSIPGDGTNGTLATLGSEANIADVIEVMPRHHSFVDDSDEERSLGSIDEAWPVNANGELEMSGDDLSEYGSEAEEVNLELPSSPAPSVFFKLESSWSPAPPDKKAEDLPTVNIVPSETGAIGFQSRSPSPTPKSRTPAIISTENLDTDSISSVEPNESQWPPEIAQAASPRPPSAKPETPLPTFTLNEKHNDEPTADQFRQATPHIYHDTIDIEKSRPSSPTGGVERSNPVSVSESVTKYLETAHEPAERPRSGRARKTSEINEDEESISKVKQLEENTQAPGVLTDSKVDNKEEKKENAKSAAIDKLVIGKDITKEIPKAPTLEETESRREFVSSLLIKSNPSVQRGPLELEGIGKEGEESVSVTSPPLVALAQPFVYEPSKKAEPQPKKPAEPPKNDLSDLAALINRNKSAKATKEKKEVKKKPKPPKSSKKEKEVKVDPQNIDFDAFSTPEMLAHMDDELKELIQQQNPEATPNGTTDSSQHVIVPLVAPKVSPEKKNAHTPSKTKKPSKQELAKSRAEARKAEKKRKEEEKKRKEEEKIKREEDLRLLKEKEEEQAQARREAEQKQQAMEEERTRRLEEEEDARREEEEAMEKLKDAKKKAREEREQRRAAEAERRKLEVQRKREEKKKREEEMREKEKEMEQTKVDQEKRKQELMEARRRQEELDRLEEERRQEEERLRLFAEEDEQRRLEEEQIREAEEELQRLQEEREYKEQMRRIAEAREQKLREEEEERLRQQEEERLKLEEERRKMEEEEESKVQEVKRRFDIARRLEAVARMRIAHEAARRKTALLRRREDNLKSMQHLRNVKQEQGLTRARVFSYYICIPRQVWEVPIGFNKQKKGLRTVKKKPAPPKT